MVRLRLQQHHQRLSRQQSSWFIWGFNQAGYSRLNRQSEPMEVPEMMVVALPGLELQRQRACFIL